MAISKLGIIQPRFPFVGVEILTTFGFGGIILDPNTLESQSRAVKTQMIAQF